MEKKNRKNFLKYFVAFYLISFLVINWNDISWVFNYRVLSDLFRCGNTPLLRGGDESAERTCPKGYPVPSGRGSSFFNYSHKSNAQATSASNEINKVDYFGKESSLEIPKLSVLAPMVFPENVDSASFKEYLDKGVVLFPGSVLPGEEGQAVVLGHSAPPNWPKIKYNWVFSRLNELRDGDEIFIYFNNEKYIYSVRKTFFLQKGQDIPKSLTNSKNVLLLISCWPPGKDIERIVVEAVLAR